MLLEMAFELLSVKLGVIHLMVLSASWPDRANGEKLNIIHIIRMAEGISSIPALPTSRIFLFSRCFISAHVFLLKPAWDVNNRRLSTEI
jgi:hypothetical protein